MTGARSILDLFAEQVRLGAHRPALREKRGGRWTATSWGEWNDRSRAIAASLVAAGVDAGDRVAILARTRQAWVETDLAVLLAGGVTVPIYPTVTAEQAAYVVADSGARVLVADDPIQAERVLDAGARLEHVVVFDTRAMRGDPDDEGRRVLHLEDLRARGGPTVRSFAEVVASGGEKRASAEDEIARRASAIEPASLATIMYTSGTSGPPKGVLLTHDNFVFEVDALEGLMRLGPHDEQVLLLPMAHVFARILEMAQLRVGFVTSFAESLWKAAENFAELGPTFFGAVPRFFEKVRESIEHHAHGDGGLRGKVVRWALEIGHDVATRRREGRSVPYPLELQHRYADKVVLAKLRATFGKRLRFAISGGAALSPSLGEWFDAIGVPILEGYGLTETTSATHIVRPDRLRFGTVGAPLPGVDVRLGEDGEILVRGRNVMKGYHGNATATAEALEGGWLHTGDIGTIGADGSLTITDRKKDILVTSGGKNVAPQNIEALLRQSAFISQAVVFGDGKKFLVALVTLDRNAVTRWAREQGRIDDLGPLSEDAELRALVQRDVDEANRKLAPFETVKHFVILDRDLSPELGEITPTMKVRRNVVYEHNRVLVDALYDESDSWAVDERALS